MVQAARQFIGDEIPNGITSQLLRSAPSRDDDVAATLVLSVSWLQGCERLQAPPDWLASRARKSVQQLPPQHAVQIDAHPAAAWMLLVSLADSIGAFEIARVLLDEIERLLGAATLPHPATDVTLDPMVLAGFNLRALASARRGRLSRQQGDVESAAEWYRDGLRLVRGLPKGDGWATCTLGLAVCAQSVGNFPETMRRCRTVLRAGGAIARHHVYGAHLTLAVAHRRRGELERALHHAWSAFELAENSEENRQQCLINVAEISLRLGQAVAARNGFVVLLQQEQPERNRIPAHAGLLEAETLIWQASRDVDTTSLRNRIDALLVDADTCQQPYERIKALLGAFSAAVTIGWSEQERRLDRRLEAELVAAARSGTTFREFEFRRDSIRAQVASAEKAADLAPGEHGAPEQKGIGARTRKTLARLMALSSIDDVT